MSERRIFAFFVVRCLVVVVLLSRANNYFLFAHRAIKSTRMLGKQKPLNLMPLLSTSKQFQIYQNLTTI